MASAQHESGTVIRIKRKRSADPFNALLVHCDAKKSKVDNQDLQNGSRKDDNSFFQFAGTIPTDEVESTTKFLDIFKQSNLIHQPDISELKQKGRKYKKETQQLARYRILSQLREEKNASKTENDVVKKDEEECKELGYNVYDVVADEVVLEEENSTVKKEKDVDKLMCNNVEMIREKLYIGDSDSEKKKKNVTEYVYDLYYAPNTILNADNEILRIEEFYDNFTLEQEAVSDDEYQCDDDDDSNAEDNWRNDYPDEDDYYSSGAEDGDDYGERMCGGGSSGDEFDHGYNRYRTGKGRSFDPYAVYDEGTGVDDYYGTVASDNDNET